MLITCGCGVGHVSSSPCSRHETHPTLSTWGGCRGRSHEAAEYIAFFLLSLYAPFYQGFSPFKGFGWAYM